MARIVVIGDALIDENIDDEQRTRWAVGGSGVNLAVGLRVLGLDAALITTLGDDADGALIRAHLAEHGVELLPTLTPLGTGVARTHPGDGSEFELYSESLTRRVIGFDRAQLNALTGAELVAISGFPLDDDSQFALLVTALEGAAFVAVDPNPRAGMLHDVADFRAALESFGGVGQLLKLSELDAELLYGASITEVLPRLRARYPYVFTTEGADGASMHIGDARWHQRALVTSDTVAHGGTHLDTAGVGDATFAAVLAEIVRTGIAGVDWFEGLEHAMRIAAATIAHPGSLLRLPR